METSSQNIQFEQKSEPTFQTVKNILEIRKFLRARCFKNY
jgi:hypothetical protein